MWSKTVGRASVSGEVWEKRNELAGPAEYLLPAEAEFVAWATRGGARESYRGPWRTW